MAYVYKTKYIPIAVVYTIGRGRKYYIKEFTDLKCPDPIVASRSRKLPNGANIEQIGIGTSFKEIYKKKYKIK